LVGQHRAEVEQQPVFHNPADNSGRTLAEAGM
jgi:hypothetical protein